MSQVGVIFSVVAMLVVLYFVTMVPWDKPSRRRLANNGYWPTAKTTRAEPAYDFYGARFCTSLWPRPGAGPIHSGATQQVSRRLGSGWMAGATSPPGADL